MHHYSTNQYVPEQFFLGLYEKNGTKYLKMWNTGMNGLRVLKLKLDINKCSVLSHRKYIVLVILPFSSLEDVFHFRNMRDCLLTVLCSPTGRHFQTQTHPYIPRLFPGYSIWHRVINRFLGGKNYCFVNRGQTSKTDTNLYKNCAPQGV